MPVSVVSVVGAFRTGKSFFLDFLLRYLHNLEEEDWMLVGDTLEGKITDDSSFKLGGFGWRAGSDRTTTGIWLWSRPFIVLKDGEKVAVLIMDTQGMFDNETGQMLTASIFGLSTLISSYQIYNVDKRIQEDNLQHLALFTEYGRIALKGSKKTEEETTDKQFPFQRLDFLVRDWQNFTEETDTEECLKEMDTYLTNVLSTRSQKDLADTRQQIFSCFKEIGCFLLPHPGLPVTSKNYDGSISKIRPEFKTFLAIYLKRVIQLQLLPKKIHGRIVTAQELFAFVKAYVQIFQEAKLFPEATTLLAATALANNHNAKESAFKVYRSGMDGKAGTQGKYMAPAELELLHKECEETALSTFDELANIGSESEIKKYRDTLVKDITDKHQEYTELNKSRDPFRALEFYLIPLMIAAAAYVLRIVSDMTCAEWSDVCATGSDILSQLYLVLFFFILIVAITTGHGLVGRVKQLVAAVSNAK